MKKSVLTLAIALVTSVATMSATCWRINPDPKAKAKYTSVDLAMNDANVQPGDTLLLDPGVYGTVILKKNNITIIGTGYFLDQKGWSETGVSKFEMITLSEGSSIEGCEINTIQYTKNTAVRRCKIAIVSFTDISTNSIIEQCFITERLTAYSYTTIKNNIILGYVTGSPFPTTGVTIENNTIVHEYSNVSTTAFYCIDSVFHHSIISNNIIIQTSKGQTKGTPNSSYYVLYYGNNNTINNNITSIAPEYANPDYSDYFVGATVESTFINEGASDGRYQLAPNSSAKGAAAHGGDCGAFGGANPYILSGLPRFLPHITDVVVPNKPTDGKISVKLKIANQYE